MDKRIQDKFRHSILCEALTRYSIAAKNISVVDGFESFIYEYSRNHKQYILRIAHSQRRSQGMIRAELDWINHLASGGVSVATAIHSENGNLVEMVDDGEAGFFIVTAFVKIIGCPPSQVGWSADLYRD